MVDTTTKTKAAMLFELESIKGLLLEEDDIPILQEVEDLEPDQPAISLEKNAHTFNTTDASLRASNEREITAAGQEAQKAAQRVIVEEQQDFFDLPQPESAQQASTSAVDSDLLYTLEELERHTADVTAKKIVPDTHKNNIRPSLAKATGENPFLPAHIRSRLHGNNPPPLFAHETAKRIANSSVASRQLGNTFNTAALSKTSSLRNAIIDNLIEKFMPDIEKELREQLQTLTQEQLDDLKRYNP